MTCSPVQWTFWVEVKKATGTSALQDSFEISMKITMAFFSDIVLYIIIVRLLILPLSVWSGPFLTEHPGACDLVKWCPTRKGCFACHELFDGPPSYSNHHRGPLFKSLCSFSIFGRWGGGGIMKIWSQLHLSLWKLEKTHQRFLCIWQEFSKDSIDLGVNTRLFTHP